MRKTGTKQKSKKEASALEKLTKAHHEYMELEDIIEKLGNALRSAYFPYVADSGQLTPAIEMELQRFKWHTMKVLDVRREI